MLLGWNSNVPGFKYLRMPSGACCNNVCTASTTTGRRASRPERRRKAWGHFRDSESAVLQQSLEKLGTSTTILCMCYMHIAAKLLGSLYDRMCYTSCLLHASTLRQSLLVESSSVLLTFLLKSDLPVDKPSAVHKRMQRSQGDLMIVSSSCEK